MPTKKSAAKRRKKRAEDTPSLLHRALRTSNRLIIWILMLPYTLFMVLREAIRTTKRTVHHTRDHIVRAKIKAISEPFQHAHTESGDFEAWMTHVEKNESTIGIILGARGTGKSALGIRTLENIRAKTDRQCMAMGFRSQDLPSFIAPANRVEDIRNGSFVLIDEGGITFSSRRSMSDANALLSELILIARHKNLSILFISQNSSNLDVNILRQADYLLLKPSSLLQLDFERPSIRKIYQKSKHGFLVYDAPGITYVYSSKFTGFITNTLPSFWNVKLSKSYT